MDSHSFEAKTDTQLLRNALLQSLVHTTSKTGAGAQITSGGTGLMGCGLKAALCTGSTKTFHEVDTNAFV